MAQGLENQTKLAQEIDSCLNQDTFGAVNQARNKGASSWLNALPIQSQGFALTKGEFRDALNIRYSRPIRSAMHQRVQGVSQK
jgi:hypothetical protein